MLLAHLTIPLTAAVVNLLPGVGQTSSPHTAPTEMEARRTLEIRVYTLKTGVRERFHHVVEHEVMPMLRRADIEVVTYGPSKHDDVSYLLVRVFRDLDSRDRSEDAFYGSGEWQLGPRESILSAIDHYSTAVVHVSAATVRSLQDSLADGTLGAILGPAAQRASDIASLLALNEADVRASETSDVGRFKELLADDFLASLPDGAHLNRDAFLKLVSSSVAIINLRAHDIDVRLTGDFAIVHARTSFTTMQGRPGASRYTDVWARRSGRWVCIAAHVTRYEPSNNR